MALEDRIKEARKNAGLTQQQAASMIGVAKSTWAGYESGNSTPDIDKLVKIMDALGVDANYLWQDYNQEETKKSPAPEDTEDEEQAIDELEEELRSVLLKHGLLHGGDITPDQNAFLKHVFALILAYFQKSI